jgi:hypothetical protein
MIDAQDLDGLGIRDLSHLDGRKGFFRAYNNGGIARALRDCQGAYHEPQFSLGVVKDRLEDNIKEEDLLELDDDLRTITRESICYFRENSWDTLSLRLTGFHDDGRIVLAYAHVPYHYFTDPRNIEKVKGKIRVGSLPFPEPEFLDILSRDGEIDGDGNRLVWVVDYEEAMKWPEGIHGDDQRISLDYFYGIDEPTENHKEHYGGEIDGKKMIAINHPSVIPTIGSREKALAYLEEQKQKCLEEKRRPVIRIHNSPDYFGSYEELCLEPRARFLVIGNGSIDCSADMGANGRFLGRSP